MVEYRDIHNSETYRETCLETCYTHVYPLRGIRHEIICYSLPYNVIVKYSDTLVTYDGEYSV